METIYRNENTRVEFKKDANGKIGCFMVQGIEKRLLASRWYKSEKSAIKWAKKVLGV